MSFSIFFVQRQIKCAFYVLLHFRVFYDEYLSFSSCCCYFLIIQPGVFHKVVILRDLQELLDRLKCAFLDSPHFPVLISTSDHLIVILRVESQSLDSLRGLLLGEVEVSYNPGKKILLLMF